MKKSLLLLISFSLLLTGCFKDKSEEAIKNCADTAWSKNIVKKYDQLFLIGLTYNLDYEPKNIFDKYVVILKQAGFTYAEVKDFAQQLNKVEIDDSIKDVIDFFMEEKIKINNSLDDHFKLSLSDRLQNREYEKIFIKCERKRKKANKTFDAKWQKPNIKKAQFREQK